MVEDNRHPDQGGAAPPPGPTPAGGPENPEVRYEHSDASFPWVAGILVAALALGVVIYCGVLRFLNDYSKEQAAAGASHYPLASGHSARLPAGPRLEQLNRMAEIDTGNVYVREESKEKALHSYGEAGQGYVHIPIERAMALLEDELPARQDQPGEGQARRQNGLVDAGGPNSGRMFREKAP